MAVGGGSYKLQGPRPHHLVPRPLISRGKWSGGRFRQEISLFSALKGSQCILGALPAGPPNKEQISESPLSQAPDCPWGWRVGKELVLTLPGCVETRGREPSVKTHPALEPSPSPTRRAGVGSLQSRAHHCPHTPLHTCAHAHSVTLSLSVWVSG